MGALLGAGCLLAGCGVTGGSAAGRAVSSGSPLVKAVPLGPQLGYVWRASDKTLRPLLGVAGSAQIGASVTTAGAFTTGAATAAGMGVLIAGDGSVYTQTLPAGAPVAAGVTAAAGAEIRFAPSAGSALVYIPGASSLALLTGWPGTVAAQTLAPGLSLQAAALSDTGAIAVATPTAAGVSVYVFTPGAGARLVAQVRSLGGMSFVPGTDDLLLTDSAANTLVRVSSVLTNPSTVTLLASGSLHAPGPVSTSAAGAWAMVANTGAPTVVRVSLADAAAPLAIACACQPALMSPLAGGSAFRITSLATGPLWLADASPARPQTLFVPGLAATQ